MIEATSEAHQVMTNRLKKLKPEEQKSEAMPEVKATRFDTAPITLTIKINGKSHSLSVMKNDRFGAIRLLVVKRLGLKSGQGLK